MTDTNRTKRARLGRSLLVGLLVFAAIFLLRRYVLPPLPAPAGPFLAAFAAGAVAALAWWVVFRGWGRRADGGAERAGAGRTARTLLLTGAIVLVLYLVFRLWLLPLFPGFDGWLGAALAGGAAGGVAAWVTGLRGRPGSGSRTWFRAVVLGCFAAAPLGARLDAEAAPIPVADLVEGFSLAFVYSLSPDGRFVLRRDRRSFGLEMYPVDARGGLGAPVDLGGRRARLTVWARDGRRLYGVRYRKRTPLLLAIDPDRPEAAPRELPLSGISGRVVSVHGHPERADRLVLRTFGRKGEATFHCRIEGPGCEPVFTAGGGWRSILGRDGLPAVRHRFRDGRREVEARIGGAWQASGEMPVDRTLLPLSPLDAEGWGLALSNRTLDTMGLVRWNARTLEERPVFSTPEADLQRALLSDSGEPLAALSFPGYPRTVALHPAAERAIELVRSRHPAPALMHVAAADAALERFVVEIFDEVSVRVAYLVDLPGGTVEAFDRSPAARFREDFSSTRAVRIPARDGVALPGLLTIPREREGLDGSDPPPLVLMIHGGPWLYYRWTFDPLVQLLASRGYAVLKLNYRGSAGYGNRFREAAVGELAGRVQDDVEDAAHWAVREGYADRSRLAAFGDSFGGFSVLTALIRGRAPVRAGVVLGGVVDTEAMVRENTFSPEGRALWAKYLGTDDAEEMRRTLREASPLRNAHAIRAPILLIAGNSDRVVQARHAEALVDELRSRGRVAELLAFPREGHSIVKPANVIEAYREILKFLDRHVR